MPQPNDLSRSLVAPDQNSTIIAVVEYVGETGAGGFETRFDALADLLDLRPHVGLAGT